MAIPTSDELARKRCVPCEGGVDKLSLEQAQTLQANLPHWNLAQDGGRIRREWRVRNFLAGMAFLEKVAELAEAEGHHPDVHLTGYRNVAIEIWTHAIGGLSENDFILAAKIDQIPVEIKA
jgi:4a-hydroxytetrahydrobiopterin dehydratase